MDAGEALVVPYLRHSEQGLNRDVLGDFLQGPGGAELGSDVERGIPLVIGDVDRSACQEQLSHHLELLKVRCQMQSSLNRETAMVNAIQLPEIGQTPLNALCKLLNTHTNTMTTDGLPTHI